MKLCEVCGLRECNHRVPADLKEEIGDGYDAATLDEALDELSDDQSVCTLPHPHYPMGKCDGEGNLAKHSVQEESAARADYYARLKKTVFVPIEVEYHEPTDVVYQYGIRSEKNNLKIVYRYLVENELHHSSVRKIIEAEIKLYESELEDLIHQALSSYELKVNEDSINGAIQALKLLANKF